MQEKFRHYFHLLIAALFVVLLSISMEVHAFDLLYGMLHGDQDTIVIGTIKEALADPYALQLFLRSNGEMTDFTYSSGDLLVDGEVVFSDIENQKMLFSQSGAESEETLPEETVSDNAASVSIIGGADGPTAIFLAGKLGNSAAPIAFLALLLVIIVIFLIRKKKRS